MLILNTTGALLTCSAVGSLIGSWMTNGIPIHQRVAVLKPEPCQMKGKQSNLNDADSCVSCHYQYISVVCRGVCLQ